MARWLLRRFKLAKPCRRGRGAFDPVAQQNLRVLSLLPTSFTREGKEDDDHDDEDDRAIARCIGISSDCYRRQLHGVWTLSSFGREESVWMDAEQKDYSQGSGSLAED
jgi:hypothetical protein